MNKRKPRIRFEGFDDEWEEMQLEEIATRTTATSSDSSLPTVEYEDINSGKGTLNKDLHSKSDVKNGIHFLPNDVLFGKLRPYLRNWLNPDFEGKAVGDFWVLKPNNCSSSFLYCLVQGRQFQRIANISSGSKMPRADWALVSESSYPVPVSFNEQQQIGSLFSQLDALLEGRATQLDKLEAIRSALLRQMFPREGEIEPELRFEGFTEPWQRCEIGEFYDFKNGLNKGKEFFGSGVPIVNFTDVFNNRGLTANMLKGKVSLASDEISRFNVRKGDLFFTRTSETLDEIGYNSVMLDTPSNTVFSGFVLRGRAFGEDPLANEFKKYVFSTDAFRAEMIRKSSMTTRALTSGEAIKRMYMCYPTNLDEQRQIGALFTRLDSLITLRRQELDKLGQVKQALLQAMFV